MRLLLTLSLMLGLGGALSGAPGPASPALTLTLEGPVQWLDGAQWKDVELGQLFGPGDQLRTGEGGTLLLSLDAARSLALEPGTQVTLGRPAGLDLGQGRVALLSAPGAAGFAIRTPNALVQAQGQDLEVYAAPQDTQVTVSQGQALLGDLKARRQEVVEQGRRRRLTQNRLLAPEPLAKRELFELNDRWERARQFHGQRQLLRHALLTSKDHIQYAKALRSRQAR